MTLDLSGTIMRQGSINVSCYHERVAWSPAERTWEDLRHSPSIDITDDVWQIFTWSCVTYQLLLLIVVVDAGLALLCMSHALILNN